MGKRKGRSGESVKKISRPVVGVALAAAAFFLAYADQCGVVGEHLSRWTFHFIGNFGEALVIIVLLVASAEYLPTAAAARWIEKVVVALVKRRREVREVARQPLVDGPKVVVAAEKTRLDDVRTAMKDLGYTKAEYEPFVAAMDPSKPLEALVREGITKLHARQRVS